MNDHRDSIQASQEDEYAFPYHHIVDNSRGFTQSRSDSWGINYLATIEYLIERLRAESFESVVDVGCGDGRFTKELMLAFPHKRVTGIDFSGQAIALARAMVPQGEFRRVDITDTTFTDRFDAAVLMEVLEHIHPDQVPRFVDGLGRLLHPGGLLYVTVPHVNKPVEYKHYRHFSERLVVKDLGGTFEVLETVYIEKKSIRKSMIDTILGNRFFILNDRGLAARLYAYYRKRLFLADSEANCQRLVLRLRKR